MDAWTGYLALASVGVVAGTLNVVAGGGSFLTLPLLIFLGLPAGVANATNRLGILFQNVGAVWRFDRHGVLDRRALYWAALPAVAGAALGAHLATQVDDRLFQRLLAFLMVAFSLISLWSPRTKTRQGNGASPRTLALGMGFLVVGIYAGFVQAGVGFLVLAVTSAAGLDLVRGNAVKVLALLAANAVALAWFANAGLVDWPRGLALAAGTTVGGQLGARITVGMGDVWIRRVVTVTVLTFAIKLWLAA